MTFLPVEDVLKNEVKQISARSLVDNALLSAGFSVTSRQTQELEVNAKAGYPDTCGVPTRSDLV